MFYRSTIAAAALALGVFAVMPAAEAARATTNLSVRAGPGTGHARVDVIPRGAYVDTGRCVPGWCYVNWRGRDGWAYARYLRDGGPGYGGPGYRYDPGYRYPGYRYGGGPDFYLGLPGFSLSIDDDDDDDDWRDGRRNRRGGWWR